MAGPLTILARGTCFGRPTLATDGGGPINGRRHPQRCQALRTRLQDQALATGRPHQAPQTIGKCDGQAAEQEQQAGAGDEVEQNQAGQGHRAETARSGGCRRSGQKGESSRLTRIPICNIDFLLAIQGGFPGRFRFPGICFPFTPGRLAEP